MWSLILGGLGAIVGSFIPGVGTALGFAIGAALGGIAEAVFAGTDTVVTKGPRISDLRVQTSTYGVDIPKIYGVARVAGNIFWAKDLREKRKIRHLDGDAEYWEYNYFANFAVGICAGEIQGVRRIWMDGKLWADLRGSLGLGTTLTSSIQRGDRYAVYPGSETQTADATISDDLGAANTPAYRGLAYIVFNDLPVLNYGNRIPEVTVEVVANGVDDNEDWEFLIGADEDYITLDSHFNLITTGSDPSNANDINIYDGISNNLLASFSGAGGSPNYLKGIAVVNHNLYALLQYQVSPSYQLLRRYSGISASLAESTSLSDILDGQQYNLVYWQGKWLTVQNDGTYTIEAFNSDAELLWSVNKLANRGGGITIDADGNLIEGDYTGSTETIRKRSGLYGAQQDSFTLGGNAITSMYYERNYNLLITVQYYNASYNKVIVYDGFSSTIKKTGRMSTSSLGLDDVVSDICTDCNGISAGDIDVTDLSGDTVSGYIRTGVMSGRKALEPLMAAFQFDAAEIDHKIHFIKRGGANVVTITEDDMAAHEYGASPPDKIAYARSQEMDVPREFNITYIDAARDYQEGTARSIRMSLNNSNISKVEYPIALTPTQGKQLAEIMHNTAYTERVRIAFATHVKYLYLAPTNPITVDGHKMRIQKMAIRDGLLQIEGVAESDANYTSGASSEDPDFADQDLAQEGPTTHQLLDIPMLNDLHDNAGFYIAAHGLLSAWVGALLYTGTSDIPAQSVLNATIMGTADDALADAPVAVWDEENTVTIQLDLVDDTLSSASISEVLNRTNWAALGVDGAWEIIAFRDVVDNGDGNYTLSGLLRGLRNTEEFTGGHAARDRFVMLDMDITSTDYGDLSRYVIGTSLIGSSALYKVASLHDDPQEYASFEFTCNALSLKPYAPADVAGSRDVSNNLTITWKRSSRINNGWDDYQDVPLGEDSEAYEVDIIDDDSAETVLRTIEVTSETASYTAEQQIADGLTPGDDVTVRIYQISETVGRGYGREATI